MNKSETHLFILWNKGLADFEKIIAEIKQEFTILSVTDIIWDKKKFFSRFCRFYTNNKFIIFWKLLHCGCSPFRMILVRDDAPSYTQRNTNAGMELVNTHMFDSKKRYRRLLKNGHLIHGSNSVMEFTYNYMILTGEAPNFHKLNSMEKWDGKIDSSTPVFPGEKPWKNLREMFDYLREFKFFLVMRNFENLPDSCQLGPHSDIDIMTSLPEIFCRLLNLKRASYFPRRAVWRAAVADSYVNMDIRSPDDGYYPQELAEHLLKTRVINSKSIPVLEDKDYFFSLLYHALIHKYYLSEEYKIRLVEMAKNLSISPRDGESDNVFLLRILHEYMDKYGYTFIEPHDLTVHFNNASAGDKKLSFSFLRRCKEFILRIIRKK